MKYFENTMTSSQKQVRVGISSMITSKEHPNCLLFGIRKGSHGAGKLATPGGHLELGESWEECAIRETKEETNLEIEFTHFVHATNDPNICNDVSKHYVTLFMLSYLTSATSELINMEPTKCEKWVWMNWNEIINISKQNPELFFDPMLHFIQTYPNVEDFLL